ncbi:MAG: DeoR family transcriptional regulator [Ignavibacteriaceae bacterium]
MTAEYFSEIQRGQREINFICIKSGSLIEDIRWLIITMFKDHQINGTENVPLNVTLNVPLNVSLSKRMKFVLDLVIADRFITIEELALKSAVSEKTIKRDLDYLRNNNILRRMGSKKTGYWEISQ